MPRSTVLLLSTALAVTAGAQNIGINANGASPHPSALLDIDASAIAGTKKGLLIPRMTAVEMNAIVAPATSLLVFNSTANAFFYFNGTAWVPVAGNTGWGLTGNTGTNAAANFIGTTDAQALRFRVGNLFAGQIGTGLSDLVAFGLEAGVANTGASNTFIGVRAGASNTSGIANVAIGNHAGNLCTSGFGNVYVGSGAGMQATGFGNVTVGGTGGVNMTSGSTNTVVGGLAGLALTTGSDNTILGSFANLGSGTLTNAAAIGAHSQANTSNSIVLGSIAGVNGATSSANVGIGTTGPLDRLHVVGNIRMVDGNQAANKVMVSDANGTATWQTLNTGLTNGWGLTGNAGTTAATNFIGTTDNQMVRFRANNTEVLRLTTTGRAEVGGAPVPSLFGTGPAKLLVASEVNGEENLTVWAAHNAATGRATLALARQRGSFSLSNNVAAGDGLGELVFSGYASNSTHVPAASIHCDVDGAPNVLSVPGKIGFSTTLPGNTAPTEQMTIRSDGAVGVGTITPDRHLEVEGFGEQYLRISSNSGAGGVAGLEFRRSGNAASDWQVRDDGGLLLFGQSADELATVNDVLRLGGGSVTPAADATITCGQAGLRWSTVFAVNGTINTSDAREKRNVRPLEYGLGEVMRLRPVRFQWKNDTAQEEKLGLIAQELQQVLPETVVDSTWQVNDDGTRERVPAERLGVYYSDLIPVLIKAIQEQQARIEELEQRLGDRR